jgi:hypothetical protein
MSEGVATTDARPSEGVGRRGVLGASAALLAAAAGLTTAGVRSAAAQQAKTNTPPPAAGAGASKALASMEAWGGSLALQAATYAAPLVAMYNLRSTVCFGPKAKAPPGAIWNFEDIAPPPRSRPSPATSRPMST